MAQIVVNSCLVIQEGLLDFTEIRYLFLSFEVVDVLLFPSISKLEKWERKPSLISATILKLLFPKQLTLGGSMRDSNRRVLSNPA